MRVYDFIFGNEEVRKKRWKLATSEDFTNSQVIGVFMVLFLGFIAALSSSVFSRWFAIILAISIGFSIYRFNL